MGIFMNAGVSILSVVGDDTTTEFELDVRKFQLSFGAGIPPRTGIVPASLVLGIISGGPLFDPAGGGVTGTVSLSGHTLKVTISKPLNQLQPTPPGTDPNNPFNRTTDQTPQDALLESLWRAQHTPSSEEGNSGVRIDCVFRVALDDVLG